MKILVATDLMGGIGRDGDIPWRCRRDLAHFKKRTLGQTLIMGRNTVESLPFKLKGRTVAMISATLGSHEKADIVFSSWGELNNTLPGNDQIICGGTGIYRRALDSNWVDEVWLTTIFGVYDCDRDFGGMHLLANFDKVSTDFYPEEDEDPAFTISHFVNR